MNTFTILLLVLVVAAVAATLRELLDGGHGCPPRSHEQDGRFAPPGSLLH